MRTFNATAGLGGSVFGRSGDEPPTGELNIRRPCKRASVAAKAQEAHTRSTLVKSSLKVLELGLAGWLIANVAWADEITIIETGTITSEGGGTTLVGQPFTITSTFDPAAISPITGCTPNCYLFETGNTTFSSGSYSWQTGYPIVAYDASAGYQWVPEPTAPLSSLEVFEQGFNNSSTLVSNPVTPIPNPLSITTTFSTAVTSIPSSPDSNFMFFNTPSGVSGFGPITNLTISNLSEPSPSIITNQYASPCINPSSACAGGGTTITQAGNISTGALTIGTGGGNGMLAVGAATLTTTSATLGGTSEGDATIQSGGTLSTGALTVGGTSTGNVGANGNLSVSGGAFNANTLTVGSGPSGVLSTLYSGSASINGGSGNVTGETIVGDTAGSLQHYGGALSLDYGAQFTTDGLVIGNQPGSVGQVTVGGASNLTSTQNIVVGSVAGAIFVGEQGTGSLSVDGSGSSVTSKGAMIVADAVARPMGQPAGGSLGISDGATVTTAGLTVGNQQGSVGSVTVTGQGSSLTSSQDIVVGASGTGKISVSNEATVTVTGGAGTVVAENPSAGGSTISVTGAGSVLAAGSSLTFGQPPGTSPFASINGGLLEIGSPSETPFSGLAMGSDAVLNLTVGPNQTAPDILTTGALDLGGTI